MLSASASITAGIVVASSRPHVNLTVSGLCPMPGPIASTVLPAVSAERNSGARFSAEIEPAMVAVSGQVISSGATAATSASAGAGTAAVTKPAPARNAPRAASAGAPDLPPAVPSVPPTTSTCPKLPLLAVAGHVLVVGGTCPKLPLLAVAGRGVCVSESADPAHSKFSAETIASSGEPMPATTIGCDQCRVNCPKTCAGLGAVNVMTASGGKIGPATVALVSSAGQPEGRSTARIGAVLALIHSSAARARPFR